MSESMETEKSYAFEVYPKREIVVVRGEGATLWDDQGNEYIDCTAGIGVANVGHCNPDVVAAIHQQAQRLITCPGIFYNDTRATLMEKLVQVAPDNMKRAFLCNSGTEAMEAAIKFARITTGKNGFISAMRGFHGRSMGALSATYKYREEFEPLIPGHHFVPYNNIEKLQAAIDTDIGAIIIELVQGEGGIRPADPAYIKQVRELCNKHHLLLIVDEIQTGFGRTGNMFACQTYNVEADIMTLAKGIAGGVPMGATLCAENISSAAGKHGSTFGGNPLACAAALASVNYIVEHNLAQRAAQLGARVVERLNRKLPAVVRDVRQLGLMIGIELKTKSRPYLEKLMTQGVLALPAGPTVIRLLPPLVIAEEKLMSACDTLVSVLDQGLDS